MRKSEVLAAEAVSCLNKALCHLKDIWEEIGIPEDQRLQRTNVVKNHIKNLLDMMIKEEESLKKRLINSIQICRTEMEKLCLELQLPVFEEENGISMLQQEKNIRTQVEALMKEKTQRKQQLKVLLEQDQDLCDVLCSMPYGIAPDSVPTPDQLKSFSQHIVNQNAEKVRRYAEFMDLKRQITLHMEELDYIPETSFENDVICEDEDSFCLSRDNIAALKLLVCQLEERKAENEAMCEAHREKIQRLWDRLQVPQEERDAFNEHMVMSKKRNLEALQAEIQRLEELKLLNVRNVTDALRSEIAVFWEKCFFSTDQRQAFSPYFSEAFTEELLSLHDAEIQRLKQHYEDHKELFDGVHQWEESWRLFLELENKATDPTRFTNRGGNLLKEQKQRSELQKSLPKLEKKLKAQTDAWESEQNQEFLVNGQRFLQYVEEQWELHRTEKEKEKQERHLKKSKQTEEDMLYGTTVRTPTKRRFLCTTTPNKSRKLNVTSSISSATSYSNSRSVYGGTVCRSPVSRPPLSANKLVETENVRGVITMNEEYETKYFCNSAEEWRAVGVEQLRLSTVDLTGVPSLENLCRGVEFALQHRGKGSSVYVHCKAGRSRSATLVAAYLIQLHCWTPEEACQKLASMRPHILVRSAQLDMLRKYYQQVCKQSS